MIKKTIFAIFILAILIFVGDYVRRYVLTIEGCPKCRQQGNRNYRAQYLEDYILSIVFDKQKDGFYVDVGAAHPSSGSVTQFFYKKGWHGINIEPIKNLYDQLAQARPLDKNYNIGIADTTGKLDFYQSAQDSGLSSFVKEGDNIVSHYSVPVRTLSEVLAENNVTAIDFLKIDVEGFELQVLLGTDFEKYRPKVILLEALDPNNLEPNHQAWEEVLTKAGYDFILFDGLNRFYIDRNNLQLVNGFREAFRCIIQINNAKKILLKEPYFRAESQ